MLDQLKHTGRISLSSCKENENPHASKATPAEKATLFRRVTAPFRVMAVGGYFSETEEMSSRPFLFMNVANNIALLAVLDVDGHQVSALFNALFIRLRLIFRNSETDKCADDAACGRSCRCATQRGHDGTGGNKWPQAGNSQRSNTS